MQPHAERTETRVQIGSTKPREIAQRPEAPTLEDGEGVFKIRPKAEGQWPKGGIASFRCGTRFGARGDAVVASTRRSTRAIASPSCLLLNAGSHFGLWPSAYGLLPGAFGLLCQRPQPPQRQRREYRGIFARRDERDAGSSMRQEPGRGRRPGQRYAHHDSMLGRDAAHLAGNLGRRTDHPREPARIECDAGVPVPGISISLEARRTRARDRFERAGHHRTRGIGNEATKHKTHRVIG